MSQAVKPSSVARAEAPASRAPWLERWRVPLLLCLVLAVVTAVVYLPARSNEFVNYDDPDYVTSNRHVLTGLSWENVFWAFTTGHASNWHPLTWLSHMFDCQLFGDNAVAHHLVNIAFHIVNTVLLFLVLCAVTGALWRSAFVAALFALHPLHVESVAWISERKDVLSTLFFLLTLGAYLGYVNRRGGTQDRGQVAAREEKDQRHLTSSPANKGLLRSSPKKKSATKRNTVSHEVKAQRTEKPVPVAVYNAPLGSAALFYWLALLAFAFGLMSKPMLVTVPFVLLLLDFWPLGRLPLLLPANWRAVVGRLVLEKAPFLGLAVASSVITFIVQQKGGAVSFSLALGGRIANALVSYERYIEKMLWPAGLSVLYPHPGHWPLARVLAAKALLLGVSLLAVSRARKQPYLLFGWLWFLGMLVPVIGLIQVGVQSMADRYTYIPLIGLFIVVVWVVCGLVQNSEGRVPLLVVTSLFTLSACAYLTDRQIRFWQSSETLFQHAVDVTDRNYLAYNNLGFAQWGKGKTAEAMTNYLKSLEIKPDYEDALNNVGYALAEQKKFAEAIPYYEAALRVRPNQAEVHNNLGNALSKLGRTQEAIAQYQTALQENPEHADAHNNLGIDLANQGKLDEAIEHFRAALKFKPKYPSAHGHLGNALALQHKLDEAIKEYRECLDLNPKDAQAHNNLGNALAEQGKLEEAVQNYRKALQLNSDNPEAYVNLGIVLGRLGNQAEAHYNMGLGFALQGKRDEAIAHFREALRLKPDYPEAARQLESLSAPAGSR
jgi:tetratricopeptide (TPR) repeat protein